MESGKWLTEATQKLYSAGIGTAHLDALVLLEDVTEHDRAWLLAHPESELSSKKVKELKNLLNRRLKHEPLAYIRGWTEFYGRRFSLTPAVLEPRPESETMIDLLKSTAKNDLNKPLIRLADVGTGSGALGITAALELPSLSVDLIDIDSKALKVAKSNVDFFTLTISLIKSDLLADTPKDYDVLLCNLPYVPDNFQVNLAALHEPRTAIYGGKDGLDVYRQLYQQITQFDSRPLYILNEALPPQHPKLSAIAEQTNYRLESQQDFIAVFKDSLAS